MRKKAKGPQLGLFDKEDAPVIEIARDLVRPIAVRFPLNIDRDRAVRAQALTDLRAGSLVGRGANELDAGQLAVQLRT
jgi:hypothetical protein